MITYGNKNLNKLSVDINSLKIVTVPFLLLNEMYRDASALLRNDIAMVKSQTFEHNESGQYKVWLAAPRRGAGKHHSTHYRKCDKEGVGWSQYKFCCHRLAVGIYAIWLECASLKMDVTQFFGVPIY